MRALIAAFLGGKGLGVTGLPKSKKILPLQFAPFAILPQGKKGGPVRSIEEQLQGVERGLTLLAQTRGRDDRRVMLGFLFKDLDTLREQIAAAPPDLRERFAAFEVKALEWRARSGTPLAPDEEPKTNVRRTPS